MMNFRVINKRIIELLGDSAAGRFTTIGYQGQGKAPADARGKRRIVQSYYQLGEFAKSGGRAYGSASHDMTFTIGLTVFAPAQADLAIINQVPPAAPGVVAEALANMREAAYVADTLMDGLFNLVYQILMDARNFDLGLPKGTITSRWVGQLKKDNPLPQGSLLVLTGEVTYTCTTCEDILGETPVPMSEGITVDLAVGADTAPAGLIVSRSFADVTQITFNDGSTIEFDDGTEVSFK